jgi:hypothetical protein
LLQPIADLPTLQGRFDAVGALARYPATCLLPLRAALSSFARHDLDHVLAVFARERPTNDLGAARATLDAVLALRRILAGAADALRVLRCDPSVGVQLFNDASGYGDAPAAPDTGVGGDGGGTVALLSSAALLKAIAVAIDGALSHDVGGLPFDAFAQPATAATGSGQDVAEEHADQPQSYASYAANGGDDAFPFAADASQQPPQPPLQPRPPSAVPGDGGGPAPPPQPPAMTLRHMIDALVDESMVDTAAGAAGGAKHVQLCFAVRAGIDPALDDARRGYAHSVEQLIEYVDGLKRDHEVPSLRLSHAPRHGYHLALDATAVPQLDRGVFTHVAPSGAKSATATTTTLRRMASDNDGFMAEALLAQDGTVGGHIVAKVRDGMGRLHAASEALALLDVLLSHALMVSNDASAANAFANAPPPPAANEGFQGRHQPQPQPQPAAGGFVRPQMDAFAPLRIVDGRPLGIVYRDQASKVFTRRGVAQSISLDGSRHTLALLTGPNGSGKTTLLRNMAHWALMAHIGCFIPATSATIPLLDGLLVIFAPQVDSSSTSASGFTQEMHALSHVLRTARRRHLILVDEIGRATSTSEGAAIAWAALERLADIRCPTVAATHFGPLTQLPDAIASTVNWHMEASPLPPRGLRFRYTVAHGACDSRQYGIALAEMTGFPTELLEDARRLAAGTAAAAPGAAVDAVASQRDVAPVVGDAATGTTGEEGLRPSADIPTTSSPVPPAAPPPPPPPPSSPSQCTASSGGVAIRTAAPAQRFPWGTAGVAGQHSAALSQQPRQQQRQQQTPVAASSGTLFAASARGGNSASPLARAPDLNVAAGLPTGPLRASEQLGDAENVVPRDTAASAASQSACRHFAASPAGGIDRSVVVSVSVSATATIDASNNKTADLHGNLLDATADLLDAHHEQPVGHRSPVAADSAAGSDGASPTSSYAAPELSMVVHDLEYADSDVASGF